MRSIDIAYMYPVCEAACPAKDGRPGAPASDYGRMPPDEWIASVLAPLPITDVVWHEQTHNPTRPNQPSGPYVPWRRDEFQRCLAAMHAAGKRVLVYTSPFYWLEVSKMDLGDYLAVASELMRLGIDGLYLDGLLMQDRSGSLELVRRLREKVGQKAVLFAHVSHRLIPAGQETVWPEVEQVLDLVADGEGITPKAFLERVRRHIRPVVWHAGPFAEAGMTDEAIGKLAASPALDLQICDWISPAYEGPGKPYRWTVGTWARRKAYLEEKAWWARSACGGGGVEGP